MSHRRLIGLAARLPASGLTELGNELLDSWARPLASGFHAATGISDTEAVGEAGAKGSSRSSTRTAAPPPLFAPRGGSSAEAPSSVLHDVDWDQLLARHGELAAQLQENANDATGSRPTSGPARGATPHIWSQPAAAAGAADADSLFDSDPELQRRLSGAGAAGSDASGWFGAAMDITSASSDPLPAAAGGGQALTQAAAAAADGVILEPLPWPLRGGARGDGTHGAAAAAEAWAAARHPWRRRVHGVEVDPFDPLPPEASFRARLPAAVARLVRQWQERRSSSPATTSSSSQGESAADPGPFEALRRQPLVRLQMLLEDAGLPTYGTKEVLLARIAAELAASGREMEGQQADGQTGRQTDAQQQQKEGNEDGAATSQEADGNSTAAAGADVLHPGRARVAAAAAARAAALRVLVDAREVCGWLLAARGEDVRLIESRDRTVVVATGASQRHAHACVEAVRWQLTEKARRLAESAATGHHHHQPQLQHGGAAEPSGSTPTGSSDPHTASSSSSSGGRCLSAFDEAASALSVAGAAASDWVALDTGPVSVNVLTQRARDYYDLEGLWGAPPNGRVFAARASVGGVGSSRGGGRVMTKDTIRAV